jgi:hypothetical protein
MKVLWRAMQQDRVLAVGTLCATILFTVPFLVTKILPFLDLPNHTLLSLAVADILRDEHLAGASYYLQPYVVPYWCYYALSAVTTSTLGVFLGAKVAVWLTLLLLPLSMMRLCLATGRDPKIGLLGFALTWDFNAYYGFLTFRLGIAMMLFFLAAFLGAKSVRQTLLGSWRVAVMALSHSYAFGLYGLSLFPLLFLEPISRRRLQRFLSLFAVVLFVLAALLFGRESTKISMRPKIMGFSGPGERLAAFYQWTVGTIQVQPEQTLQLIAFACVLLLIVAMPIVAWRQRTRISVAPHARARGLLLWTGLMFVLYLAMPPSLYWPRDVWALLYPRQATLTLLLAVLIARATWVGRAKVLFLILVFVSVVCIHVAVIRQFLSFAPLARDFVAVVDGIPQDTAVLGLFYDFSHPAVSHKLAVNQFAAYAAAVAHGYSSQAFDEQEIIVRHRRSARRPKPGWDIQASFRMEQHARHYDVIITRREPHPLPEGMMGDGRELRLVKSVGEWKRYEASPILWRRVRD